MGKKVDDLKKRMLAERLEQDPHEWAYEVEQRENNRSLLIIILFLIIAGVGWQLSVLHRSIDTLQAQQERTDRRLENAEYVIVP